MLSEGLVPIKEALGKSLMKYRWLTDDNVKDCRQILYVFDRWMEINYPQVPFERYADDTICHVKTKEEAEHMKEVIMQRFSECKLTLNAEKTKIVHCEDSNRREGGDGHENSFDFLGYTFRPRGARNGRTGQVFTAFTPAISNKSVKKINEAMKSWKLHSRRQWHVNQIVEEINP